MKKYILLNLLIALMLLSSAWSVNLNGKTRLKGSGKIVKKELSVSEYNKINIASSVDLIYQQEPQESAKLVVETDDNLIQYVKAKISNGQLEVYLDTKRQSISFTKLIVYTSSKDLTEVKISGSGDFTAKDRLRTDNIKLAIEGSGDIDMRDLDVNAVNANIGGSGDIKLAGKAQYSNFNINGSGDIDAFNLSQSQSTCNVAGSGDIKVYAKDKLKLSINGSGDIAYKGANNVDKSTNGSGDIVKID